VETRLTLTEDASLLAALHRESFGSECWGEKQIADSLALATTVGWIALADKNTQGFILCQNAGDDMEILTFCVAPAARRQGAGRLLLNATLAEARQRNAKRVFLEVAADSRAATELYEMAGFRVIGKRAGYYRRGNQQVDALMYGLDLG
jgi:ribosomal-protein-alanine N-acetyltransferase